MSDPSARIMMPPYAYVPGQNARHPENLFDPIKSTVLAGLGPEKLHETDAFRAGLIYLDAGFFWECHEVLEAVWMQTTDGTPEREMVQALIQLANAKLKVLMQRPRAALRLCDMVAAHLNGCPENPAILGVRREDVMEQVLQLRDQLTPD